MFDVVLPAGEMDERTHIKQTPNSGGCCLSAGNKTFHLQSVLLLTVDNQNAYKILIIIISALVYKFMRWLLLCWRGFKCNSLH